MTIEGFSRFPKPHALEVVAAQASNPTAALVKAMKHALTELSKQGTTSRVSDLVLSNDAILAQAFNSLKRTHLSRLNDLNSGRQGRVTGPASVALGLALEELFNVSKSYLKWTPLSRQKRPQIKNHF